MIDIVGLREALPEVPEVEVDAATARRIRNGEWQALDGLVPAGATIFKVIAGGRLLAVARADSTITARLLRIFSPTIAPQS